MARIFLSLIILSLFFTSLAPASDNIGVDEKLGQIIPLDLTFYDENGSSVKLGDLINKPAILTLVYYRCDHICPQMLLGLSDALTKLDLKPGRDYQVITLSFDDTDTPKDAREKKINYIKAANRHFPEDSWRFLTGDRENIVKISDAVGIRYKKLMHGFIHPEVLVFISPSGIITRYLHVSTSSYGLKYPVMFSAVEFTGAITDASKGIIGSRIKQTPLLCFPHEPVQQENFFNILKTLGAVTLLLMISLFIYFRVTTKKLPEGKK